MILVIDDHWETGRAVERLLTFQGYAVRTASSGSEGIALACECRPRLVVADANLMNMPAEDLRREMRFHGELLDVPVVFYIPKEPEDRHDDSVNFGPRDWLARCGVSWSELLAKVSNAYAHTPPLEGVPQAMFLVG